MIEIKDCIFAMDETFTFRLVELGFPPKDFPMSSREIMSDLLGDDPEFNAPEQSEDVGLYYVDLIITFSTSFEGDSDVDYSLDNIRNVDVCLTKNHLRKNLFKLLVQKLRNMKSSLRRKEEVLKESSQSLMGSKLQNLKKP